MRYEIRHVEELAEKAKVMSEQPASSKHPLEDLETKLLQHEGTIKEIEDMLEALEKNRAHYEVNWGVEETRKAAEELERVHHLTKGGLGMLKAFNHIASKREQ